jgi:hypothetical protein
MANIESTSATVRGPLHEKLGIERQDSAGHLHLEQFSSHIIVVADGHGDPSCARSAVGSSIAVEVTKDRLSEFVRAVRSSKQNHDALLKGTLDLTRLTDSIVSSWSSKVAAHYDANPDPELDDRIANAADPIEAKAIREHLYGTTLVAALVMPDSCLVIQQGDGCCALIYSDGTVRENDRVITADPLCVGNVTTSLSDRAAADEIRTSLIIYDDALYVIGCFVGSDGIDKSLPPDGGTSDFAVAAALARLDADSNEEWTSWLTEYTFATTDYGSGDDASAACCVDLKSLRTVELALRTQHERFSKGQALLTLRKKLNSMQRKRAFYLSDKAQVSEEQRASYLSEYDSLAREVRALEEELDDRSDWEAIERSFLEAANNPQRPVDPDGEGPVDNVEPVQATPAQAQPAPQAQPAAQPQTQHQAEVIPFAASSSEAFDDLDISGSHTARIIRIVAPIAGALVMAAIALFIIFRPVKEFQSTAATQLPKPLGSALSGAGELASNDGRAMFAALKEIYKAQDELIDADYRAVELAEQGVDLDALKQSARKGLQVSLDEIDNADQGVTVVDSTQEQPGQQSPDGDSQSTLDEETSVEGTEGTENAGEGGSIFGASAPDGVATMRPAAGEDGKEVQDGRSWPLSSDDDDADDGVDDSADSTTTDDSSASDAETSTQVTTSSVKGVTYRVTIGYDGPDVNMALRDAYAILQRSRGDVGPAQDVIDRYVSGDQPAEDDTAKQDTQQEEGSSEADSQEQTTADGTSEDDTAEPTTSETGSQTYDCVIVIAENAVPNGSADGASSEWRILDGSYDLKIKMARAMGLSLESSQSSYADNSGDEATADQSPDVDEQYVDDDDDILYDDGSADESSYWD